MTTYKSDDRLLFLKFVLILDFRNKTIILISIMILFYIQHLKNILFLKYYKNMHVFAVIKYYLLFIYI